MKIQFSPLLDCLAGQQVILEPDSQLEVDLMIKEKIIATQLGSLTEEQSTNKLPLFNRSNYTYWKACIRIFIQALDYDLWCVIINGLHIPTIVVDGIITSKSIKDLNEKDKK